jgi:ABC-2 type transport system permease protein
MAARRRVTTTSALGLSARRIRAIFRRHAYLLLHSWPRLLELVYWPAVQMLLWGYLTLFLQAQSGLVARAGGLFLSAVLLWDTLFRGQLGVAICFLEEMYARHLGHLFVSPLRPWELVVAVFAISLLRVAIGVGGAALLAVPIFGFSLPHALGWALLPFFAILLAFGWAIGLVIVGLVLRLGLAAENLAWGAIFLLQPISGVYYPIATLPSWLQPVAWLLPSSAVFEGMRIVLIEGRFDLGLLTWAVAMLGLWFAGGALAFLALFRAARRRGLLLQVGE